MTSAPMVKAIADMINLVSASLHHGMGRFCQAGFPQFPTLSFRKLLVT